MNMFQYLSASKFLNDRYQSKKIINPNFSIRSWALQMGMSSHGGLQQILSGRRTVPKKYLHQMVKTLKLSSRQAKYFELLVDYEKAKKF